jgi:hypothetical protein
LAAAIDTPAALFDAVSRLTGDSGHYVKHGQQCRIVVTSRDGHQCGIPVQVDTHASEMRPYMLNQIADSFLINRAEILEVLERGTHDELVAHLSRYSQDQLRPVRFRQVEVQPLPFWQLGG